MKDKQPYCLIFPLKKTLRIKKNDKKQFLGKLTF